MAPPLGDYLLMLLLASLAGALLAWIGLAWNWGTALAVLLAAGFLLLLLMRHGR